MTTQKFSKSEAIGFGWNTMKSNLGFFIGLLIMVGLIYFVPGFIAELVEEDAPLLSIIISLAGWVISIVVQMGLIRIALRFCDNEEGEFADLFSCFPLFFKYLLGSILYGLIVLGGTILLIIPGIIWFVKFQFFGYFIVYEGLKPIEALRKSSAITTGAKWDLFLFDLLLGLINLAGALCLLIGLFATIPTTMVAMAFVYRKLLAQTEVDMPKEEKFCMNCGAKIPADAEICPVCETRQPSSDARLKERN
jgi:ribosomal protein L40E